VAQVDCLSDQENHRISALDRARHFSTAGLYIQMPKGHKRKNAGVGVDFKKAKHKVGKTLAKAENATDPAAGGQAWIGGQLGE